MEELEVYNIGQIEDMEKEDFSAYLKLRKTKFVDAHILLFRLKGIIHADELDKIINELERGVE